MVFDGRMLGRVEQAVLSRDGTVLRGLIVRRGFGGARWLAVQDVQVLGQVTIIAGCKPGKLPHDASFALGSVRDTAGLDLGRVTDVYLSADNYRVIAIEMTLGPLEELRHGRMLARTFTVSPASGDPGQVLIPTGYVLEKARRN